MAPQIISRKEALAAGLPRYFTGKPCENGHVVEWYTACYTCTACEQARNAAYRAANRRATLLHTARVRARKNGLEFDEAAWLACWDEA